MDFTISFARGLPQLGLLKFLRTTILAHFPLELRGTNKQLVPLDVSNQRFHSRFQSSPAFTHYMRLSRPVYPALSAAH